MLIERRIKAARVVLGLGLALALGTAPGATHGQSQPIDASHSVLKVRVFKSGLFSGFAHDHEIEAPISEGAVEISSTPRVRLQVDAGKMRVLDPDASASTRAEIQKTMEGPSVLDAEHFARISFESSNVQAAGKDHWKVTGNLSLHGATKPVVVDVALADGHYRGTASLKQKEFGITPVSVAGGTVKVKDELKIEFDIVLKQQ